MDWKIGHCIGCVQNDLYHEGRLSKKLPQAKHAFEAKDPPCILRYTIGLLGNWIFVKTMQISQAYLLQVQKHPFQSYMAYRYTAECEKGGYAQCCVRLPPKCVVMACSPNAASLFPE